jgi:hypothetical protein
VSDSQFRAVKVVSLTTVTFPSVLVVVTTVIVETGVFDTSVLFIGFETS